ncbi:MAG: hypothetical protein A2252_10520 [Elusimicrobia bacterium RIFOXYA2_FULL_39_19]|nr:MAG: hypothetical protein A2252_10520 [Elusimicrobia bacterium RIFOXYA2_FULL_39_19]
MYSLMFQMKYFKIIFFSFLFINETLIAESINILNVKNEKINESHIGQISQMDKNNFDYHLGLGDSYKEKGDFIKALNEYKKCIKLCPENTRAHERIGDIYSNERNYDLATSAYNNVIILAEQHFQNRNSELAKFVYARVYNKLAKIYDAQNKKKEAKLAIETANKYTDEVKKFKLNMAKNSYEVSQQIIVKKREIILLKITAFVLLIIGIYGIAKIAGKIEKYIKKLKG